MVQTTSLYFLNQLSSDLKERITHLESLNHRHERILRYLALCQIEEDKVKECIESKEPRHNEVRNNDPSIYKESSDSHDIDVASSSSTLDSVLLLAREIREKKTNRKLGTVINHPIVPAEPRKASIQKLMCKPSVKSALDTKKFVADAKSDFQYSKEKIDQQKKSHIKNRIPDYHNDSMREKSEDSFDDSKLVTLRDHLFAQLDILKRRKKECNQFYSYDKDKELYCCQYNILSHLNGRPTFPNSIAYCALKHETYLEESNPYNSDQTTVLDTPDSICLEKDQETSRENNELENKKGFLMNNLKANRENYDKMMKIRLNRTPISEMATNDLKEIFSLWYKTQKYLEFYEDMDDYNENDSEEHDSMSEKKTSSNVKNSMKMASNIHEDTDMQRLLQLKIKMIDSMPINLSDDMMINDEILITKEWYKTAANAVDLHHEAFDNRLKFVIETAIGRYELRNTVKKLKECCASEKEFRNKTGNRNKSNKEEWVSALKYYKAVYCCLTTEAQDFSSCIFISKDK